MRALILSAGLGERLRPLTLKRAKPAIEFLNMPMLAFPYYWLDTLGLTDLALNIHYLPETIRHAAMHVVEPSTQLHFTFEDIILGSGGGIWNARFHLQGEDHFAVANGDAVVAFDDAFSLQKMLAVHRKKEALATLLVCPLEGVGTRTPGVWLNDNGEVQGFGKSKLAGSSKCLHYASIMLLSKRIWDFLPEGPSNILYDALVAAMAKGESVIAFAPPGVHWFETGNEKEYLAATRSCLELIRDSTPAGVNLQAMLTRFAPSHALHSDLNQLHLFDQDVEAKISGFAVIGAEASITEGVRIQDSVVLPGAAVTQDLVGGVLI